MSSEISLDDAYAEEGTEVEEAPVEVKDESGDTVDADKVAAAQPEADPEIKPVGETTAPKPPEGLDDKRWDKDSWMYHQAMDERKKSQDRGTRVAELEAKLSALESKKDEVSIFDNEEEWKANQAQETQAKIDAAEWRLSRAYAVDKFGEEKVAAAELWTETEGKKSPYVLDSISNSSLRYHKAIELMDDETNRTDPEKYAASVRLEEREKLLADGWSPPESKETQEDIIPSLASSRSAGNEQSNAVESDEDILN